MTEKTNHFKLGVFVLVGVGLLVVGILAFGARNYFKTVTLFETYMEGDVDGLSVGSLVELRGVPVGKVRSMNFSWNVYQESQPGYVVVVFEIQDDISPLPPGRERNEIIEKAVNRGLRARVKAQGITGTCILSLEYLDPANNPPAKVPWTPRNTYIPSAPGLFGELMASIERSLGNIEKLDFASINALLQSDLKSVNHVLNHVDEVDFGSLSTNANSLLVELRISNTRLKALLARTDGTVADMHLEKLSLDLDALVSQAEESLGRLEPGLANIDFDALNQTLQNARQVLQEMDGAARELKRYPSGFLFGSPPPKLRETEPIEK